MTVALNDLSCTLSGILRTLGKPVKSHHRVTPPPALYPAPDTPHYIYLSPIDH
jgi:hypothetical protein